MKPKTTARLSFPLASAIAALLAAQSAHAGNYYWDTNGNTAGLGDTAGTWDAAGNSFVSNMNGGNSRSVVSGTIGTNNQATTTSDWMYFGTVNLGLGSTASTVTVGTRTIGNIVFGAGQASPVTLTGGTITLANAGSITANNSSNSISSVLGGASTSFTKGGAGTLNLTGANLYTGTTIVSGGGTLTVGDGTTGSLNGTTGTALAFNNGGGTLNVAEAASSTQGMGALTFSAGDGTLISTAATGSSTATLTFASLAARAAGATGNFALATNTTAADNQIVLSSATNAPLDTDSNNAGYFFGGTEYARYDTTNGYFRAVNYGTDTNALAALSGTDIGAVTSATDVKLNGAITAQTTASVNTINLAGNSLTLQDTSQVLSVNGILSTGGSIATAGTIQPTSSGGEMVFNVTSGTLSVAPAIQNNTSASPLTKSGAGTLTLSGANTYTGTTRINSGTLAASGGSAIADTGALVLANAAGATFQLNNDETIGNLSGGGLSGGNVNVQGNTLTLSDNSNQTFGGQFTGTSSGGIIKQGSGTLTLSNPNSFAGTLTMSAGALRFALGNNGSSSAISMSSGGTISMGDGTTLRFEPAADLASGNLGTTLAPPNGFTIGNAINVSDGTASMRFYGNDCKWTFGGVTGGTSGAQTLAIYQGGINSGSGDRQDILFSGVIADGSGGTLGLNVDFAGASAANQGAYVNLSNSNTFTGPISVANSKNLNYVLSSQWGGYLVIGGERRSGSTTAGSGSLGSGNYSNTISLATGTVLDYLSSADQILGGEISGAGSILKEGTGTLTLSGPNSYAGTTKVSAGTLLINGNQSLATGAVEVNGSSTLGGSGTIGGAVTVSGGATLAPGASIESLAAGSLNMAATSIFAYEVADNSSTGADLLAVGGTISLNDVTLSLDAASIAALSGGGWSMGDKLTLISYLDAGSGITSGFTGYVDDASYFIGANEWLFDYNDTLAGDNFAADATASSQNRFVTMTVIPEPSAALLGGLGLLALLRRRRA